LIAYQRKRRLRAIGVVAGIAILALAWIIIPKLGFTGGIAPTQGATRCELQPYRQEQAAALVAEGAIIVYERNGGPECIDELYAIFPDGRIVGDDGEEVIEKQLTTADVDLLMAGIVDNGWFTGELYDTWHTPCGQCYGYYLTVVHSGQEKTVKGVDGGTDAPAVYWQIISLVKGVVPKFGAAE
jgi:hypothetical protein